jgi:hypothetical protein
MGSDLQQAIVYIKSGNRTAGQELLVRVIRSDPQNEMAWLWMTVTLDDPQQKKHCLQTVLQINPDNQMARRGLAQLEPSSGELPAAEGIVPHHLQPKQAMRPTAAQASSGQQPVSPGEQSAAALTPGRGTGSLNLFSVVLLLLLGVAVVSGLCIAAAFLIPDIGGKDLLTTLLSSATTPTAQQPVDEMGAATPGPQHEARELPPIWTPVVAPSPASVAPTLNATTIAPPSNDSSETPVDFVSALSKLSDLKSYRSTYHADFSGAQQGQLSSGYDDILITFVREPSVRYHIDFDSSGWRGGNAADMSYIRVGDTAWGKNTAYSNVWVPLTTQDASNFEKFALEQTVPIHYGMLSRAHRDTIPRQVNGVQCDRYTYSEKDIVNKPGEREISRA